MATQSVMHDDDAESPRTLGDFATALLALDDAPESSFQKLRLLRHAASTIENDPNSIFHFLIDHVFPLCLRPAGDRSVMARSQARELLHDWINGLPENLLWDVRARVIKVACAEVQNNPSVDSLYSLASLGYRSSETLAAFRMAAEGPTEVRNLALRLMLGMHPAGATLRWCSSELRRRLAEQPDDEIMNAAAMIGGRKWLKPLTAAIESRTPGVYDLARFGWLCGSVPGDERLNADSWKAAVRLCKSRPDGLQELLFTGGLVSRCKSRVVVQTLLDVGEKVLDLGSIHLWRWAERLQDTESFTQVLGWKHRVSPKLVSRLLQFASKTGGQVDRQQSEVARIKSLMLRTLLSLGSRELLTRASEWIADGNVYEQHALLEQLAVLSLSRLPEGTKAILRQQHRFDSDESYLLPFLASARLAASSCSRQSLQRLIDSDSTSDAGGPFVTPVQAAAELALWLFDHSDGILPLLAESLSSDRNTTSQAIAVSGLHLISSFDDLDSATHLLLLEIATDGKRPYYVRTRAIETLTNVMRRKKIPSAAFVMKALAKGEHDSNEVRLAAATSLAMSRQLASDDPDFQWISGAAAAAGEERTSLEGSHLLGICARNYPDACLVDAATVIESDIGYRWLSVLDGFESACVEGDRFPQIIRAAIMHRLSFSESESRASPQVFTHLVRCSPDVFAVEDWQSLFPKWMAETREAFAVSLGYLLLKRSATTKVGREIEHLEYLLEDPTYKVRRAAARAISAVDPDRLDRWADARSQSASVRLRELACEVAGWLTITSVVSFDNRILRRLAGDAEGHIRKAAATELRTLQRRAWAAELSAFILSALKGKNPNAQVLTAFSAGMALSRVGDDSDIETLRDLERQRSTPPNVRHWLSLVRRDLEKQWAKTLQERGEQFFPLRSSLEINLKGSVRAGDDEAQATVDLWRRENGNERRYEWGGTARINPRNRGLIPKLFVSDDHILFLTVADRRTCKVAITGVESERISFVGAEAYPDHQVVQD